uniref:Transmembrane protein n=1 Tax=Cajanus cajan TaxID=3821 RepID=A0A151RJS0_CAJCA|nr:hypothetical protein KK1_035881 [Cajanus cajan]
MEEEDRKREAAIASTPLLQPNFNPKGITQHQLSKFRVGTLFASSLFSCFFILFFFYIFFFTLFH